MKLIFSINIIGSLASLWLSTFYLDNDGILASVFAIISLGFVLGAAMTRKDFKRSYYL